MPWTHIALALGLLSVTASLIVAFYRTAELDALSKNYQTLTLWFEAVRTDRDALAARLAAPPRYVYEADVTDEGVPTRAFVPNRPAPGLRFGRR